MPRRVEGSYDIAVRGEPLLGMWLSGNNTGASFGIKTHSRNVHVTVFLRDNLLNCHITDTGKVPQKIWEKSMLIDDLRDIYDEFAANCEKKYYWHQRYYQLSDDFIEQIILFAESPGVRDYDIEPLIKASYGDDVLIKKRIRRGFYDGQKMGFVIKGGDWHYAVPYDKRNMLVINTEMEKTPFWEIPTVQGFTRYFDYLDEEHILEQTVLSDPDRVERMRYALFGALAEADASISENI